MSQKVWIQIRTEVLMMTIDVSSIDYEMFFFRIVTRINARVPYMKPRDEGLRNDMGLGLS